MDSPIIDFLVDVLYFGLRNKMLAGALAREKPKIMERLLAITDAYINEEEMSKLKYREKEKKSKGKEYEREDRGGQDGR